MIIRYTAPVLGASGAPKSAGCFTSRELAVQQTVYNTWYNSVTGGYFLTNLLLF